MHDPNTVAFEIRLPFTKTVKRPFGYLLATIWHVDPEKFGDDDSCGWFQRAYHLPKEMVDEVKRQFLINQHNWYTPDGVGKFSEIGMAMNMYRTAIWVYENHWNNNSRTLVQKRKRFMDRHLYDIMHFAENDTDSISDDLRRLQRPITELAGIIIADIARYQRPWYKHPRWHIHHWKIQFHPFRDFWKYFFKKCDLCGKRGYYGKSSCSNGKIVYHCGCEHLRPKPSNPY